MPTMLICHSITLFLVLHFCGSVCFSLWDFNLKILYIVIGTAEEYTKHALRSFPLSWLFVSSELEGSQVSKSSGILSSKNSYVCLSFWELGQERKQETFAVKSMLYNSFKVQLGWILQWDTLKCFLESHWTCLCAGIVCPDISAQLSSISYRILLKPEMFIRGNSKTSKQWIIIVLLRYDESLYENLHVPVGQYGW